MWKERRDYTESIGLYIGLNEQLLRRMMLVSYLPMSDKVSGFDHQKSSNLSSTRRVELGGAKVEQARKDPLDKQIGSGEKDEE